MVYSSCRHRFKIRADEGLGRAHDAICSQYDVPLDEIAKTVSAYRLAEPSVELYRALLAETWLSHMFSSLSDLGWGVNRPFEKGYSDGHGSVVPTGIAKRLQVKSESGQPLAEFDDFVLLRGRHSTILEATSGVNSYSWNDVKRKMKNIFKVTGARPGYIFAAPSDHCLLSNGWTDERNGFLWRGGKLIQFDAVSSEFQAKAESLYANSR